MKHNIEVFGMASGRCPDGFVKFGASCYYFSNDVGTWTGSQVVCSQAFFPTKANLVEINSQTENEFLYQRARENRKYYWVGASDLQITGMYRWLNSGKVVAAPAIFWAPTEPQGGSEHCMAIVHDRGTSNCWIDISCNHQLNFICETPAK
ncbi:C-type lectin domain family 6 member A-like isoform X2 [Dreissena polymorpha]|uniref:C-type lectin domain family 6 member A-like isoform X2 n=1 Tax=Dreissena polymorpha TaxID=45954 RepID=UPI002264188C|nr:C-type lectin domain family 6 member A-like isoform X2 [Dreissena polymorpha]